MRREAVSVLTMFSNGRCCGHSRAHLVLEQSKGRLQSTSSSMLEVQQSQLLCLYD